MPCGIRNILYSLYSALVMRKKPGSWDLRLLDTMFCRCTRAGLNHISKARNTPPTDATSGEHPHTPTIPTDNFLTRATPHEYHQICVRPHQHTLNLCRPPILSPQSCCYTPGTSRDTWKAPQMTPNTCKPSRTFPAAPVPPSNISQSPILSGLSLAT